MTDTFDLMTAFEGLSPEEAKELTDRIRIAVEKVITRRRQPVEKNKRQPMTKAEARQIFDAAIRRYMAEKNVSYTDAFYALQREKPELVEGYSAVIRRTR